MAIGTPIRAQSFRRIQMGDQIADRMQDNVQVVSQFLESVPFLDGTLIEGVELTALTTSDVEHKLNRKYRGWLALNVSSAPSSRFTAYLSSTFSPGVTSQQTVVYQATLADVGGGYDTSTGNYTVPQPGIYTFGGTLTATSTNDGDRLDLNHSSFTSTFAGSGTINIFQIEQAGNDNPRHSWSRTIAMSADSFCRCRVANTNSSYSLASGSTNNRFYGVQIGDPVPVVDSSSSVDTTLFLPLTADKSCTVDLWVF